ncbi:MAG: hypothetical protein AUJ01_05680 [Acidobacteria bacterium 13_1_40CM_3_65_5]|nr:MAG: hypothetical protein AUJ01_05680 [Acidobacteria bacterium 13_1_40CM_3_65_5]
MTLPHRRAYIDWARGIAVLLMIEAHTADAWTRAAAKKTIAFRDATILGGFAAPLFLFLAGLALVLSATRTAERTGHRGDAVEAICRRGLEIFILAFLFRVQALMVSPGGPLVSLFRVDILNVMGPAIVLAGIVWGLAATTTARVVLYAAIAAGIGMVTPIVRTAAWVSALPVWLQWYLRPTGDYTTFTMFPWAGFAFAGGAVGVLLAAARDLTSERRVHVRLSIAGAALIGIGFITAAQPTIYHASAYHAPSFWTSSPTWFAIRVGILIVALTAIYGLAALAERVNVTLRPLALIGRHSLFVYWIHVELVYGYASRWWLGRLPLWGTAVACAVFSVLTYGAVLLRHRVPGRALAAEKRTPDYRVA